MQIAYKKSKTPDLAKVKKKKKKPYNLNNFHLNKSPYNLPYRVVGKLKREINALVGKPYISRNWELQFVGEENDQQLKKWLFDSNLKKLVPQEIIEVFYANFKEKDQKKYSHPVSMLLTLSLFQDKFNS